MAAIDLSYLNTNKVDPIQSKIERLNQFGYDSELKPKTSVLEKLLDILPRSEAVGASILGGALKGQDIGTTLSDVKKSVTGEKKYSAKDILTELGMEDGMAKKIASFALGTAIDPLTYIPVGKILGGAKKVGQKIPGVKNVIGLGDDVVKAAKKAVGIKTYTSTGMKDLDTILKGASGGVNYSAKLNFEKYAPIFEGIMKTSDDQLKLVSRAIEKPNIYLKKLDDAGLGLYNGLSSMLKETGETKQTLGIVKELVGGQKAKQLSLKGIDTGKKFLGIGGAEADSYLPHLITDEFRQKILDMGKTPEEAIGVLRGLSRTGVAKKEKTRTLLGTIADLNRQAKKKYGVDIFESDLKKIVPKYLYNYSKNTALVDLNKELLKLTDEVGSPLIKQLTGKNTSKDMVKLTSLPYEGAYQTSPEVAQMINRVNGVLSSDPTLNKFLKRFDKLQNAWKRTVTVVNPSFHLNNLMGGSFNNLIKDPGSFKPDVLDDMIKTLRKSSVTITAKNGNKITGKELLEQLNKRGALTNFVSPDQTIKPLNKANKFMNRWGGNVENLLRTQLAVSQYKKTGNIMDAVRAVWEVHGNYNLSALSSTERNVIKRVAPFYIWAKTNIPFQIKSLVNKTGKYSALARLQNQVVSPEERAQLPEWMRGQALGPIKTNADGTKSVSPLNLPVGDLNDLTSLRTLLGNRLSPFVKAPIERMTNKNLFYDSELFNKDLPRSMQKGKAPELLSVLPPVLKKLIGYQETQKVSEATGKETTRKEMDAKLAHILNTFGGTFTRYANVPKSINDELTAGGLDKNNINTIMSALNAVLNPARARVYDPIEQASIDQKIKAAQLQDRINYLIQRKLIPKLK